jgi:hypothetical protein
MNDIDDRDLAGLPPECAAFRRAAGAEPARLPRTAAAHAAGCTDCAAHLRQLLALDAVLLEAMRVPVPPAAAAAGRVASLPTRAGGAGLRWPSRQRWLALAASVLGGVAIGTLLWVSAPRATLAQALVEHMAHEPESMVVTTEPVHAGTLAEVLAAGGMRLRPEAGKVSYANTCEFRGARVPHLVVQTGRGPVTVMVLRGERPAARSNFELAGHHGAIVPAGPGSVAVIGVDRETDREFINELARELAGAIEWLPVP